MSDNETQPATIASDKEVMAKIAAMEAELNRLRTNPRNLPTRTHCNVCGEDVKAGEYCARHPADKVNHVREGLPGEPDMVLVKQI